MRVRADLLQDLEPARLGEGARDAGELAVGQAGHRDTPRLGGRPESFKAQHWRS
jgi:hypothetical protein